MGRRRGLDLKLLEGLLCGDVEEEGVDVAGVHRERDQRKEPARGAPTPSTRYNRDHPPPVTIAITRDPSQSPEPETRHIHDNPKPVTITITLNPSQSRQPRPRLF